MFKTLQSLTASLFWMVIALYLGHVFTDELLKFFIADSWATPGALLSAAIFYFTMRWLRSDAALQQTSRINVSSVAHFAPAPGKVTMWETQSPYAALFQARAFAALADRFTAWWLQYKAQAKAAEASNSRMAAKPQGCANRKPSHSQLHKPACNRPQATGPRL